MHRIALVALSVAGCSKPLPAFVIHQAELIDTIARIKAATPASAFPPPAWANEADHRYVESPPVAPEVLEPLLEIEYPSRPNPRASTQNTVMLFADRIPTLGTYGRGKRWTSETGGNCVSSIAQVLEYSDCGPTGCGDSHLEMCSLYVRRLRYAVVIAIDYETARDNAERATDESTLMGRAWVVDLVAPYRVRPPILYRGDAINNGRSEAGDPLQAALRDLSAKLIARYPGTTVQDWYQW